MEQHRDIVVIGASAGGVHAVPFVIGKLPKDLNATVVVVQHLLAGSERYLADIIQTRTELPVVWAEQGERIERGRVYVAPPDYHTVFTDGHLRLDGGARENHSRPSISRSFRSAAAAYGSRTIGVVLTGMLDDGATGLAAIQAVGGRTVVQDPKDAEFPEMPRNALAAVDADFTVPLANVAPTVLQLIRESAPQLDIPLAVRLEAELDRGPHTPDALARLGEQTHLVCPDCHGPMWAIGDHRTRHFRCYLGHTETPRTMLSGYTEALEQSLWLAVRALHDRATTFDALAGAAERSDNSLARTQHQAKAEEARAGAKLLREFKDDLIGRVLRSS